MLFITPKQLQGIYRLAFGALERESLVRVIKDHLRHPRKYPAWYHGPEGRPEDVKKDPMVAMTQREWGKYLGREISEQEANTIIGSFQQLAELLKEVKNAQRAVKQ
jgi:hypothetical protein